MPIADPYPIAYVFEQHILHLTRETTCELSKGLSNKETLKRVPMCLACRFPINRLVFFLLVERKPVVGIIVIVSLCSSWSGSVRGLSVF